jgi:hypothetical protein
MKIGEAFQLQKDVVRLRLRPGHWEPPQIA